MRVRRLLPILLTLILFFALVFGANPAREGARMGLSLAFNMALPALFPFFVAGTLLNETGVTTALGRVCARPMHLLYGLPGAAAGALVLGFTGGYPVGVQAAADLYRSNYLDKEQAERLLGFCNNTGPAFIIGVCGAGVFGSVKTGIILYVIHILSALLCGLVSTSAGHGHPPAQESPRKASHPKFSTALVDACERAAQTSIKVAAFITLFCVFAALLDAGGIIQILTNILAPVCALLGMPESTAWPLVYGGLELTRGLAILPEAALPMRFALPVASALLAFGGLSVWCQSLSLAADTGLSLKRCLRGKILHAALAAALGVIWCTAAPSPVPVFASAPVQAIMPLPLRMIPIIFILFTMTSGKWLRNRL